MIVIDVFLDYLTHSALFWNKKSWLTDCEYADENWNNDQMARRFGDP